jgi:hypothetical protein
MRNDAPYGRSRAGSRARALTGAGLALAVGLTVLGAGAAASLATAGGPPQFLHETGLYSDAAALRIDPAHLPFAPQYPLWTDGATKRRWISLPPGTAVDASDPDAWVFPVGTRLWKEFAFGGVPVETRYIERRPDGRWLYAAYAWSADGRSAALVPEQGRRGAYPLNAKRAHTIPGVNDCKACHEGGRSQVLGFGTLQLSSDRDPLAPHAEPRPEGAVDIAMLVARGLVVGLPAPVRETPPQIQARSAVERAALGYLHGNCGHCHNAQGPLRNLGLFLRHETGAPHQSALATTVARPVRNPAPGQHPDAVLRIDPQHPERSALTQRIASRYPPLQMPPLGTELVDRQAVDLIRRWIENTPEKGS